MGYDRKYGKVTTEFGTIGEDEPVVVFRAQDKLLVDVMAYYMMRCAKAGSPTRHIKIALNTLETIKNWQMRFGYKVPASESSKHRLAE